MAQAKRDDNQVTTLLGVSNADGTTPVTLYADPTTHRLLVTYPYTDVVGEAVSGSGTTYTLANTPVTGSVHLFLNGVRQNAGAGNDYTISGATITFGTAPLSGDVVLADYKY